MTVKSIEESVQGRGKVRRNPNKPRRPKTNKRNIEFHKEILCALYSVKGFHDNLQGSGLLYSLLQAAGCNSLAPAPMNQGNFNKLPGCIQSWFDLKTRRIKPKYCTALKELCTEDVKRPYCIMRPAKAVAIVHDPRGTYFLTNNLRRIKELRGIRKLSVRTPTARSGGIRVAPSHNCSGRAGPRNNPRQYGHQH